MGHMQSLLSIPYAVTLLIQSMDKLYYLIVLRLTVRQIYDTGELTIVEASCLSHKHKMKKLLLLCKQLLSAMHATSHAFLAVTCTAMSRVQPVNRHMPIRSIISVQVQAAFPPSKTVAAAVTRQ